MLYVRSFIFQLFFYATTIFLLIIGLPWYVIGKWKGDWILYTWSTLTLVYLRVFLNIKVVVKGQEILDHYTKTPYILAAQHQSPFETFVLFHYCKPAFVYKNELNKIPLFGFLMRQSGMLSVDRGQGPQALKNLLKNGKKALGDRGGIVIFPEGKRMPVGEVGKINPGLWALYHSLKTPTIPVTLNSGICWPPKSFLKYSGEIHLVFHAPIEADLSREDFDIQLKDIYAHPFKG